MNDRKSLGAKHLPADNTSERGMALLIVLWIVVSAALIVSSLSATVRSGVSFVNSEVQLAKTEALLDAGLEIAAARQIEEDKARTWSPDGTRHFVSFAGSELAITIRDPSGLIDLNKTKADVLLALFAQFTDSETTSKLLRDAIVRARGAEVDLEGGADGAQQAEDQRIAFFDVGQLRTLPGMTPDLYDRIAPFVTVYSQDGRINPRTAPNQVISSIPNVSKDDVNSMRRALQGPGEQDTALQGMMQRASAYLTDKPSPARIVSVEVHRPGDEFATRQVFVIVLGLDTAAPYRLISKRPLVSIH